MYTVRQFVVRSEQLKCTRREHYVQFWPLHISGDVFREATLMSLSGIDAAWKTLDLFYRLDPFQGHLYCFVECYWCFFALVLFNFPFCFIQPSYWPARLNCHSIPLTPFSKLSNELKRGVVYFDLNRRVAFFKSRIIYLIIPIYCYSWHSFDWLTPIIVCSFSIYFDRFALT